MQGCGFYPLWGRLLGRKRGDGQQARHATVLTARNEKARAACEICPTLLDLTAYYALTLVRPQCRFAMNPATARRIMSLQTLLRQCLLITCDRLDFAICTTAQVRIHASSLNAGAEGLDGKGSECTAVIFEEVTRNEAFTYITSSTLLRPHFLPLVAARVRHFKEPVQIIVPMPAACFLLWTLAHADSYAQVTLS